ncbi:MAG: exodeoxyribonuclease V subunit alpha [Sandaracinaceae bacterium]|nr:exodeoxyribonuclease V subunit alpha [Sandaracinaceae bacterium]
MRLSREQEGAVRVAAQARLALVSGGPGTGKTSIVVSLLRVLVRLGYDAEADVALAAPTGKAADRMRASVARALRALRAPTFDDAALLRAPPHSQTLHRLLGYSPRSGRYRAHERSPLGARVVVVDEASMIDAMMMDRLLRALGPDTRLVLLGDADQLPSVDAGAVFRDLCALPSDGVVRLTHSYRMDANDPAGRNILKVAQGVHRGRLTTLLREPAPHEPTASDSITPVPRAAALRFSGCEWVEAPDAATRAELLGRWDDVYLRPLTDAARALGSELVLTGGRPPASMIPVLESLFTRLERAKLLALTRAGSLGVERVNQHFHVLRSRDARARFVVGEPVMVHHNDYVRGLFNGDAGVVLTGRFDFERGLRRLVLFRRDDGFVGFPLSAIEDGLELAYAITVHKAQGSEYDAIGVLLPDVETPLLTREILYTAITRARRSVTLVGPRWAIEAAVTRRVTRSSGLLARVEADLAAR